MSKQAAKYKRRRTSLGIWAVAVSSGIILRSMVSSFGHQHLDTRPSNATSGPPSEFLEPLLHDGAGPT